MDRSSDAWVVPQSGMALLEALVALFIFSFGILGLIGMYAASIKNSTEAKFRTDSAFLADSLIGEMQVADPGARATNYASPSGSAYMIWRDKRVYKVLPGARTTGATPVVAFDSANTNQVTVTLKWRANNDSVIRQYIVTSVLDPE